MDTSDNFSDDPKELKTFIAVLIDGWEQALHTSDSALQVAQQVPDWQEKFQQALNDPLRIQTTQEKFAPMKQMYDAFLQGTATDLLIAQFLSKGRRKSPN